jgi:phosphate transport system ATP-binding protein
MRRSRSPANPAPASRGGSGLPDQGTHNLQQAQRVAGYTGFLYVDTSEGGRTGYLVEFGPSRQIFEAPEHRHTQAYIRGEFS